MLLQSIWHQHCPGRHLFGGVSVVLPLPTAVSLRLTYEELAERPAVSIRRSCQLWRVTFLCVGMTRAQRCCFVLCGMSVSRWPVSDIVPILNPQGKKKKPLGFRNTVCKNRQKCWLQQLSTLLIISLLGDILTSLFNELLHLINFMLLGIATLTHITTQTSSSHTVCLPRNLSRKNFCPLRYTKYLVLKALNLTL